MGTTTLLTDAEGVSRINVDDLAVDAVDEVERRSAGSHFTVGTVKRR
ncbi:hypothetical protein G4H71_22180 [Rhodococcus triatomae]|nr:hypothetical protein [Rhodococcus triatomae]QNG18694.1 hypothetical protein G4H72_08195 [Rhodococcus triatomae]QNG25395.1 hypothetical protein G4H71_22180 [Rhodococcus triatomae]